MSRSAIEELSLRVGPKERELVVADVDGEGPLNCGGGVSLSHTYKEYLENRADQGFSHHPNNIEHTSEGEL